MNRRFARLSPFFVPALFLLGILLRAVDLKRPFRGIYAWNEAYYSIVAVNFGHYGWHTQMGPDGPLFTSNPLVPWLIALSFHRFGAVEWAGRLPFFLLSLVSLAAIYGIARAQYPDRPAVARGCLLCAATMPGIVFFSRNIQLDGPMTAFGLLGLWLALLSRRPRGLPCLVLSVAAMAACITLKYTGILALPAWWVALGLLPARGDRRKWLRGGLLTLLVIAPAGLAIHWVLSLQTASPLAIHGLTTHDYFFRFSEWHPSAFRDALLATWATLPTHWGHALWYPFLVGLPWLFPHFRAAFSRHPLVFAIILPWYLQIGYPVSWVTNEYYDYFALYGVALGLGVLLAWLAAHTDAPRHLPRWAFLAAVIVLSNLWDYKTIFHVSYFPDNIVREATPFASAKLVRQVNTRNAPVLCEQSQTMFYAGPDPAVTTWAWWENTPEKFTGDVLSGKFQYVAVEYTPPVGVVTALQQAEYRQIAPGAWEKR